MNMTAAMSESSAAPVDQAELYRTWTEALEQALRREKDYRKLAGEAQRLYEAEKATEYQYNILYSNVETLSPALYNSVPRPQVRRRFKDADPLGMIAARTAQRLLEYQMDNGSPEHETFDQLMEAAVLSALVPGRAVQRFRYWAEIEGGEGAEQVRYETVYGESVPWNHFRHGFALTWQKVPWISYETEMDRKELLENFPDVGALVEVNDRTEDADSNSPETGKGHKVKGVKTAQVFEIWDKASKRVLFLSPGLPNRILKSVEDPLRLEGFFDCPEPLVFTRRVAGLTPVPLYEYYKEQHRELNRITYRIQMLIKACKVRGMYDAQVQGIEKALEAEDNTLLPAENLAQLQGNGQAALEKALWLFPIDKIVAVLQQLYVQRQQIKQVIFEITGIADIMRGSSQASETLGAQELKNQWGTLRLKRSQKRVATYARDCLRLMAEIAVNKLSIETIAGMTGLSFPRQVQKDQARAALQQLQQIAAAGQPVQPPAPDILAAAKSPSWEEVLEMLRSDLQRSYRIDIETNSTVDVEATEDKKDVTEMLTAISQFFSGLAPLIQNGALPFELAKTMLIAVLRRFRFGEELEEQIQSMQQPQSQQSPELQKQATELQKQAERQQEEARQLTEERQQFALEMQQKEAALALQRAEFEGQMRMAAKELQLEVKMAAKELELTAEGHQRAIEGSLEVGEAKLAEKETSLAERGASEKAELDGKRQELEQGGSQLVQAQKAIAELLEDLQKFAAEVAKQGSQPRPTKAVKTAEGTWELR